MTSNPKTDKKIKYKGRCQKKKRDYVGKIPKLGASLTQPHIFMSINKVIFAKTIFAKVTTGIECLALTYTQNSASFVSFTLSHAFAPNFSTVDHN